MRVLNAWHHQFLCDITSCLQAEVQTLKTNLKTELLQRVAMTSHSGVRVQVNVYLNLPNMNNNREYSLENNSLCSSPVKTDFLPLYHCLHPALDCWSPQTNSDGWSFSNPVSWAEWKVGILKNAMGALACPARLYPIWVRSEAHQKGSDCPLSLALLGRSDAWQAYRSVYWCTI